MHKIGIIAGLLPALPQISPAEILASYRTNDETVLDLRLDACDWAKGVETPSAFGPSGNLIRAGGAGTLLFRGWGGAVNSSDRIGFRVSAKPGFRISLEKLTGVNTAGGRIPGTEMESFVWAYRIDHDNDGTFETGWVYGKSYTALGDGENFRSTAASKNWNFGSRILTKGTVEFGLFGTAPGATSTLEAFSGELALHGEALPTGVLDTYMHESTRTIAVPEASGVTYNRDTGTLFVIGDEGHELVELDKTGVKQGAMPFDQDGSRSQRALDDPEGVSYLGNGEFAICDERRNLAVVVAYDPEARPSLEDLTPHSYPYVDSYGDNSGLEGIAWDPLKQSLWSIKELGPVKIYEMPDFPEVRAGGTVETREPISRRNITGIGVQQFSDIYVMAASDWFHTTDPRRENILLLGRDAGMIYEITRDGLVVGSMDLNFLGRHTIEGITMDDDGWIYLVSEGAVSTVVSELHVLRPTSAPIYYSEEDHEMFRLYSEAFSELGVAPGDSFGLPSMKAAIEETRLLGRQDVLSSPETHALYTEDSIQDLRGSGVLIRVDGDSVELKLPIERCTDLNDDHWSDTGTVMEATLPKTGDRAFYRVTLPGM